MFPFASNASALSRQHALLLTLVAQSAAASIDFKTFYICHFIWSHSIKYTYVHYKITYNSSKVT